MKLCWVTLQVKDFEKSLEFYHGILGLPICSKHGGENFEMAMLGEEDKPKIEIISTGRNFDGNASSGMSVGLEVDSIDDAIALLKKNNITIDNEPVSPNPSVSFFFINDPDGYTVQLVEMKG